MTDEPIYLPFSEMPEVLDHLVCELKETNTPEDVVNAVLKAWGGRAIYFPQQKYQVNLRNSEMMKEFTGRNVTELCAKYKITRQRFYQILRVYRRTKRIKKGR